MNYERRSSSFSIATTGIVIIFLLVILMAFIVVFSPIPCQLQAQQLGLDYHWNVFTGCYVNAPGLGWWPLDRYLNTLLIR